MKKLIDYLNALAPEDRDPFAAQCETSFDYLRQVGYGNRPCKEALAIRIERATNREIRCEELCPDVDWAFIRASDTGAPKSGRRKEERTQEQA